jgi:hypothetical protein
VLKVVLVAVLGALASVPTDRIELPTPEAARVQQSNLIVAVGGRPDRLLKSDVPGPVINDETVRVGVGGDGTVRTVTADQRLQLTGEGDYAIRERGPARSAVSLSQEPPPVTRRGAVVWQGFSPGRRDLGARLTLDPLIEAQHLPLTVTVTFTRAGGAAATLLDGGRLPGPGTVTVTISNVTSQPVELPTAADVAPAVVAGPLDRALAVARHPSAARLPSTDDLLPKAVAVAGAARVQGAQAVPLRLRGALHLTGTTGTVSGPATTPTVDGASFAGTLGGVKGTSAVTFTVQATGPGALALDLTAVNALNPTELAPPNGFATWRAWATANPPLAERRAALDLLVEVAATGARASSYSPYLGADLLGAGSTTFSYGFAPAVQVAAAKQALHPRWGAISLAGLALLLLLTNGFLIWRRS